VVDRPLRTDLPFLRRRVKPRPAPLPDTAATTATTATGGGAGEPARASSSGAGLVLGGRGGPATSAPAAARPPTAPAPAPALAPALTSPPRAPRAPGGSVGGVAAPSRPRRVARPQPFVAPDLTGVRELGAESPLVRLSPRRSAIGTLAVVGGVHAMWESTDLVDGAAFASGERQGDSVVTSGNRPLVAFDGDEVLVTLRHVRELRRAHVVAGDGAWLRVDLPGDRTLAVDPPGPGERVALSLLVVDGRLELRRVTLPDTLTPSLVHQRFGYSIPERPGDSVPVRS